MKFLFFFIDGIGFGANDPEVNPFVKSKMPITTDLLGGRRLVAGSAPLHNWRASLISLDACLGVKGMPQSATGQAVLLTGKNIPAEVGFHFGPWPNQAVVDNLDNGNLFSHLKAAGLKTSFLNAYPPTYFEAINSGKRLYSAIPQAAISAGIPLLTDVDLNAGKALSADFTAQGWHDRLELTDTPILSPYQAGERLAQLSQDFDFSFFEYWLSDYAGHGQDMDRACQILETFDRVLEGLLSNWDPKEGLIFFTSDHGNMEDLSTRRHTTNPVPALVIGVPELRRDFISDLRDLTDVAPAILRFFNVDPKII